MIWSSVGTNANPSARKKFSHSTTTAEMEWQTDLSCFDHIRHVWYLQPRLKGVFWGAHSAYILHVRYPRLLYQLENHFWRHAVFARCVLKVFIEHGQMIFSVSVHFEGKLTNETIHKKLCVYNEVYLHKSITQKPNLLFINILTKGSNQWKDSSVPHLWAVSLVVLWIPPRITTL